MHQRYGFELITNTPEEKVFKTSCDCGHPDDDCYVYVNYDKELNMLSMDLSVTTHHVPYWWTGELSLFDKIKSRIQTAFNILRGRPLKYETSFIFRGREHIEDFCDMIYLLGKECKKETTELHECRKKLRKYEEKNK